LYQQVHKIPGTVYANVPAASTRAAEGDPESFKAKMNRLKDENSTNLYMEGLADYIHLEFFRMLTLLEPAFL
jgi:hypothetical protein